MKFVIPRLVLVCVFVLATFCAAQKKGVDPKLVAKANAGDAQAQTALGVAYADGIVVSQDYAKAASWFQKAADQGAAQAQDRLGKLYESGSGVQQDDGKAALLYRRAAEQNLASAQLHLGLLYQHGVGVPENPALAAGWYN